MQHSTLLGPWKIVFRSMFAATAFASSATIAAAQATSLASHAFGGGPGNDYSFDATLSADGRWVAFRSYATNLVANDTNGVGDAFLFDRQSDVVARVSVSTAGAQGDGDYGRAYVSADGSTVAFASDSTTLVADDTNGAWDVFVRDVAAGITERVSVTSSGAQADSDSSNDVIALTPEGRFVAFATAASNLASGDTNGLLDVYLRDRVAGTTERISVDSSGAEANGESDGAAISSDARWVVFSSWATNLVAGDTNGFTDVFRKDRQTGVLDRVSVGQGGVQLDADSTAMGLSADGRLLLVDTLAQNLGFVDLNGMTDVFVRDLVTGAIDPVTVTTGGSSLKGGATSRMGSDGRFVVFAAECGPYDASLPISTYGLWLRDRVAGTTELVSRDNCGGPPSGDVNVGDVSLDGQVAAYYSAASFVAGDHNLVDDVLVFDRNGTPPPIVAPATYCTAKTNSLGCQPAIAFSGSPSASSPSPFSITASQMLSNKPGLLFYGIEPWGHSFQGGTLCMYPPLKRTSVLASGGNPPPEDCSGSYAYDFNALIQSGGSAFLTPCREVFAQYWARDPNDAAGFGSSFSNALSFQIAP